MYKIKPFLSLKMNAIKNIQKRRNDINSRNLYEIRTKNKVFNRLLSFSIKKINKRNLRDSKIYESQNKINMKLETKVLKLWKTYLKEQLHYQKIMNHLIQKNKKTRIFNSWKTYSRNSQSERLVYENLSQMSSQKLLCKYMTRYI